MQKKNPVIKNYILSPDKYFLRENNSVKTTEISIYHLRAKQNMAYFFPFLLRK